MNLIFQNFNMIRSITKKKRKLIILISFLYFIELIFVIFGQQLPQNSSYKIFLVLSFGIIFFIFFICYLVETAGKFSNVSFYILFFAFISLLIGLSHSWEVTDILADASRFCAPLLAFFLGKKLFHKLETGEIKIAFMFILKGLLYLVIFHSIVRLFGIFILGDPFVKYPDGGVDIPVLLLTFFLVSFFYINPNYKYIICVGSLFVMMALSPIMSASKSTFITAGFSLAFIPFFFGKFQHKLLIGMLLFIAGYLLSSNDLAMLVIDRFISAFNIVFNSGITDMESDGSSFARVIEFQSAVNGLNNSDFYPLSYLIGTGSGSLWYTTVDLGSGLNEQNFRADSGGHHIHIELVTLFFRHGLIGLFIYLSWMANIAIKSYAVYKIFYRKDVFFMSLSAAVFLTIITTFLTMLTDQSLYGHFTVGLVSAIPVVIYEKIKLNPKTVFNKFN
jgi:hypothetical protein